jgi:DNA-binding transcriptional ArsR family regulator
MGNLDVAFAALADPTRRSILLRLAQGEATVTEIARPLPMSQPAVSQHVRVLVDAGLVRQRIDGTRRPCRLSGQGLASVDAWLAMLRKSLEANYDRLDALLAETASPQQGKDIR